jgi:hypothetical protein
VLCTTHCKIDIPLSQLKTFEKSDGEKVKDMDHSVEMAPSRATADYTMYADGRKHGARTGTANSDK